MFCKYCGKKIREDSKFCKHCGKEIASVSLADIYINSKTIIVIGITTLLLAVIPIWPYSFYIMLRLYIFVLALYLAYKAKQSSLTNDIIYLLIIAIIYNPLIPIHLTRAIWTPIDIAVGIFFMHKLKKLPKK